MKYVFEICAGDIVFLDGKEFFVVSEVPYPDDNYMWTLAPRHTAYHEIRRYLVPQHNQVKVRSLEPTVNYVTQIAEDENND